ncbi:MAG: DNA-binding protein [Yoonia sp.]|nr:DNA-binding protein [Yoonia sp.]
MAKGQSAPNTDPRQTFLTGPQVQSRYQKSHVTIWRWIRDSELAFPQPLKINRLNYWCLADLEAWETAQKNSAQ